MYLIFNIIVQELELDATISKGSSSLQNQPDRLLNNDLPTESPMEEIEALWNILVLWARVENRHRATTIYNILVPIANTKLRHHHQTRTIRPRRRAAVGRMKRSPEQDQESHENSLGFEDLLKLLPSYSTKDEGKCSSSNRTAES